MGYLATEIIALLGGAAVLGLVIGWALFGLGKKTAVVAGALGANPKVEADLKAERDARKKAEGRIIELESKETNFNDRLQERDTKVAELSHQLDDISKYRVQSAAELDARDQKINALEAQLRQREADLAKGGSGTPGAVDVAERDRTIASLKAELEASRAAGGGPAADNARIRELERENAELRLTLITTDGAAPTTASEKDAVIARLNEEVTGLRAAYESAEQALEEQDAAIDKLTRDLQATQHKLAQAVGDGGKTAGPISVQKPRPIEAAKAEPPKAEPPKAEPPKAEPPKASPPKAVVNDEATVAVSLADLVGQIDQKAATTPAPIKTVPPPQFDSESTVAVSLADLVGQIDQKADQKKVSAPAAAPVEPKIVESKPEPMTPPPMPAAAPIAAPAAPPQFDSESTMALSLADLVDQIDKKAVAPVPPSVPAAPTAPPAPVVAAPAAPTPPPESESTMALSLDDLVAQIDAKPAGPPLSFSAPEPRPMAPPAAVDVNESTVAVSLADLVGQIDNGGSEIRLQVAPAPAGRQDDLKEIRGIGPATEKRLNSAGIMTWGQMAGLSEDELTQVADLLKISVDKIKREQWVEQARALAPKG